MIKSSGRNVGKYFTGGAEEINQPGERDEVIWQKNKDDYFTVGDSLIGGKIKVVYCNIKSSHL